MHRKVCFILFILLIFPTSISSQSNDLIELSFDSAISNVTWSPTGSKLAFVTGESVQIYDRAEQNLQTIHLDYGGDLIDINHLVWSQSEQYIAVLNDPDQTFGVSNPLDVYVYRIEDGSLYLDFDEVSRDYQYIFGAISDVNFSLDDRMLSLISGQYVGGQAYESNVYLVDMDTGEIQSLFRISLMGAAASRTEWSPSGNLLAVDFGSFIELWDPTTLEEVGFINTDSPTAAIDWGDEQTLITIGTQVQRWNIQTGELLSSLPLLNTELQEVRRSIDYDPSTNRVQFRYYEAEDRIEIFHGSTGQMTHLLLFEDLDDASYDRYVFNGSGTAYAGINDTHMTITAIDLPAVTISAPDFTVQYVEAEPTPDEPLLNVYWRSDNTLMARSEQGVMHLAESQPKWRMIQPVGDVQFMESTYSPSGQFQAVGMYDSESRITNIQLWDLIEQTQLLEVEDYLGNGARFAFSADETLLAVATGDMFICIWNIQTAELQHRLSGIGQLDFLEGFSPYTSMAFSPDNRYLGAVGDGLAHIWNIESDDYRRYSAFTEYAGSPHATTSIIFGPDSTSFTFRTMLFDSGALEQSIDEFHHPILLTFNDFSPAPWWGDDVFAVQVSHDGSVFATTDRRGNIELFDAASREAIPLPALWCREIPTELYPMGISKASRMDFSPDSAQFAFVSNALCISQAMLDAGIDSEEGLIRNTIWIIDARTGEFQYVLEDINVAIRSISFSPDGTMLLAELDDQSFALWETEDFQRID